MSAPSTRVMPSTLPALVAVACVGLLALSLLRTLTMPLTDPDLWWHIALGDALFAGARFEGPDPLGWSAPHYTYNQWLPEVVYSGVYAASGLAGVALLSHVLRLAVLLSVYAVCRRLAGPFAAALVTVASFLALGGALSPRPQVIGLVLLVVVVDAAMRVAAGGRLPWWLVPLFWLWACSHGTWPLGLAVLGVGLVGRALDDRGRGLTDWRPSPRSLGVVVSAGLVVLVTPVGPRLIGVLWEVRAVSGLISEWQRAPMTSPSLLAALALAALPLVGWLVTRQRPSWVTLGLVALGASLALSSTRAIAPAAVVLAQPAAAALAFRWPAIEPSAVRIRPAERKILLGSALATLLIALPVAAAAMPGVLPDGIDRGLAQLPSGTVVFTMDSWGGWVGWAHPGLRPTLDTRAEAFGPEYLMAHAAAAAGEPGWDRTVAATGATAAVLPTAAPMVDLLIAAGWRIQVQEGRFAVLEGPRLAG